LSSQISAVKTSECKKVTKKFKERQDPQTGTLLKKSNLCMTSRS